MRKRYCSCKDNRYVKFVICALWIIFFSYLVFVELFGMADMEWCKEDTYSDLKTCPMMAPKVREREMSLESIENQRQK